MQTPYGHLSYCSNIHAGESWGDHFAALQAHLPQVMRQVAVPGPFGIGLRLSDRASVELGRPEQLEAFRQWLAENNCYVFTMNGFPFGSFHHTQVKDKVHAPDWTTEQRVQYTLRLARLLARLLPDGVEGGISTSPLTYRHWHKTAAEKATVFAGATINVLRVVEGLVQLKKTTGKTIHLDVEPEPDGLLENGHEFLQWYVQRLLPLGTVFLGERLSYRKEAAAAAIREHVQLCYDVCHFAVGYEDHQEVIAQLQHQGIRTGKIQISAALKGLLPGDAEARRPVTEAFRQFNEPTYLHQVIARLKKGRLASYPDLPQALEAAGQPEAEEWRAHFHVPIFIRDYGVLQSTQQDIQQVLRLHRDAPFTRHLEVETYTWEVLPENLKLPLPESIARELQWVLDELNAGAGSR